MRDTRRVLASRRRPVDGVLDEVVRIAAAAFHAQHPGQRQLRSADEVAVSLIAVRTPEDFRGAVLTRAEIGIDDFGREHVLRLVFLAEQHRTVDSRQLKQGHHARHRYVHEDVPRRDEHGSGQLGAQRPAGGLLGHISLCDQRYRKHAAGVLDQAVTRAGQHLMRIAVQRRGRNQHEIRASQIADGRSPVGHSQSPISRKGAQW